MTRIGVSSGRLSTALAAADSLSNAALAVWLVIVMVAFFGGVLIGFLAAKL